VSILCPFYNKFDKISIADLLLSEEIER